MQKAWNYIVMSSGVPKDFWVREAVEEIYQQPIIISQNYQQAMITKQPTVLASSPIGGAKEEILGGLVNNVTVPAEWETKAL